MIPFTPMNDDIDRVVEEIERGEAMEPPPAQPGLPQEETPREADEVMREEDTSEQRRPTQE